MLLLFINRIANNEPLFHFIFYFILFFHAARAMDIWEVVVGTTKTNKIKLLTFMVKRKVLCEIVPRWICLWYRFKSLLFSYFFHKHTYLYMCVWMLCFGWLIEVIKVLCISDNFFFYFIWLDYTHIQKEYGRRFSC